MKKEKMECKEPQISETDVDITRTFTLLASVLILATYLSLSVTSFSLGAIY